MNKTTIPRKNTIWVGADSGPNPLQTARDSAISGDTIIVIPGTYYANDLLKDGVNWHFQNGAIVINSLSKLKTIAEDDSTYYPGLFDDNGDAITSTITGDGTFITDLADTAWRYTEGDGWFFTFPLPIETAVSILRLNNSGSNVSFSFANGYYRGFTDGQDSFLFQIVNCEKCILNFDTIGTDTNTSHTSSVVPVSPGDASTPAGTLDYAGGVYWVNGDLQVNGRSIRTGYSAVWAQGIDGTSAATNCWVNVPLLQAHVYAAVYQGGDAPLTWKLWITAQEIKAESQFGTDHFDDAVRIFGSGKVYISSEKIGAPAGVGVSIKGTGTTTVEAWITAQKISAGVLSSGRVVEVLPTSGSPSVTAYFNVLHYEEASSSAVSTPKAAIGVTGTGAKVHIKGGVLTTASANAQGVTHTSGSLFLNNLRIVTNATNDADNVPITVAGSGLVINGCTLVPPALAPSISGAGVVKVYADSFTNLASTGVTFAAGIGTLIVDTDVT